MRKSIKPVATRPGTMYGLCKVHKQKGDDYLPPFWPILLTLQTPTYNLPVLDPLTKNEYTVKDSFHFSDDICEQDPS